MSLDTLEIGATPCEEDCAQVGSDDYSTKARAECRAFINLLIRSLGEPPEGCELKIKSNPHDFGSYLEVVARFDSNIEAAVDYAYRCEGPDAPLTWDEQALAELGLPSRIPAPPPPLWNPGSVIGGDCLTLDAPEDETETSIRWGRWTDAKDGRWFLPNYMNGSDYSGTLVERSNVAAWQRDFADGQGVWWKDVFGGYSTFGIVVDRAYLATDKPQAEEAREFLDALDGYPLADESLHSEMQFEAENEAWKNWARADFAKALQVRLEPLWKAQEDAKRADLARYGFLPLEGLPAENPDDDEIPDLSEQETQLAELFSIGMERSNESWENEQGSDMWIRVEKIVEEITDDEIMEVVR